VRRAALFLAALAAALGVAATARAYADPEEASATVAAELNEYWTGVFAGIGRRYKPPLELVWYDEQQATACGATKAQNAMYCPLDKTIYVDHSLFAYFTFDRALPFAIATVIAHEWGHGVQDQLGLFRPVRRRPGPIPQLEWEADCYAGMWARWAQDRGALGATGIADGLAVMIATGDPPGSPRYFSHGSSDERAAHFLRGYATQSLRECERVRYGG
jgi:predicted metalloprotease